MVGSIDRVEALRIVELTRSTFPVEWQPIVFGQRVPKKETTEWAGYFIIDGEHVRLDFETADEANEHLEGIFKLMKEQIDSDIADGLIDEIRGRRLRPVS